MLATILYAWSPQGPIRQKSLEQNPDVVFLCRMAFPEFPNGPDILGVFEAL